MAVAQRRGLKPAIRHWSLRNRIEEDPADGGERRLSGSSGASWRLRLGRRLPARTRRWLIARVLATTAVALFAIGAWMPWVSIAITFNGIGAGTFTTQFDGLQGLAAFSGLALDNLPGSASGRLGSALSVAWVTVALGGVLLCPIVWQWMSARAGRVVAWVYTGWALIATAFATIAANALARMAYGPYGPYGPASFYSSAARVDREITWGFPVMILGLALGWGAAELLRAEARRGEGAVRSAMTGTIAPRSRLQLVGAAIASRGLLVWGLGFLALPWATVNCSSLTLSLTHYVDGSCAGLDAADALAYAGAASTHVTLNSLSGGLGLLAYGLLAGGALLVIGGSWWLRVSRWLCLWLTLWPVAAVAAAIYALRGVSVIRQVSPVLASSAVGTWVTGPGVSVTFAGLLLVVVGLGALWVNALRSRDTRRT